MPNWSVVASYASTMHGMTKNLALDLKPIRVNLVSPGAIDTELWKDMPSDHKAGMFKAISEKVPTGHVGKHEFLFSRNNLKESVLTKETAEEVADAYLWLMKDSNVTGFTASSDGGLNVV
jgi:NAD(P)-dependent dehydrogenase (short-subunit alcohol dehydrogenase family)